jgi:hypothetical protein
LEDQRRPGDEQLVGHVHRADPGRAPLCAAVISDRHFNLRDRGRNGLIPLRRPTGEVWFVNGVVTRGGMLATMTDELPPPDPAWFSDDGSNEWWPALPRPTVRPPGDDAVVQPTSFSDDHPVPIP